MPAAAENRNPNLRLVPALVDGLRHRAAEYEIPLSQLVAILVRNDEISPAKLAAVPADTLSRIVIACSLGKTARRRAGRGARRCGLNRNAYLEALVAAHLAESGPLVVLRSKGNAKL